MVPLSWVRGRLQEHQQEPGLGSGHSHVVDGEQLWGLVMQSEAGCELDGCYVLKTIRHSDLSIGDCTCIHYSLTRVCRGEPLAAQIAASWLL